GLLGLAFVLPAAPEAGGAEDKAPASKVEALDPAQKEYTETIPGTKVKFKMVPIPRGTYRMGSPAGEEGPKADEGPPPPVTGKPFWMGACEVTWDEFDAYWRGRPGKKEDKEPENPKNADAVTRPTPPYADETFELGREGFPVICITHHTAMQYCRWLSL